MTKKRPSKTQEMKLQELERQALREGLTRLLAQWCGADLQHAHQRLQSLPSRVQKDGRPIGGRDA